MTICEECKEEVTRARWIEGKGWFCLRCAPQVKIIASPVFPFTTSGILGKAGEVEVKSMRHLRQLERENGIQSVAFNQDSPNWDCPPRGR